MATYDQEDLGVVTGMSSVAERPWASMRALKTCVAAILLSVTLLSGAAAAANKGPGGALSASGEAATPPEIAEQLRTC
jgi:hypothetical protein